MFLYFVDHSSSSTGEIKTVFRMHFFLSTLYFPPYYMYLNYKFPYNFGKTIYGFLIIELISVFYALINLPVTRRSNTNFIFLYS